MWIIWELKQNSRWRTNGTWPRPEEEEEGSRQRECFVCIQIHRAQQYIYNGSNRKPVFSDGLRAVWNVRPATERKIHAVQWVAVAGGAGLIEDRNSQHPDWLVCFQFLSSHRHSSVRSLFAPLFYTLGREKSSCSFGKPKHCHSCTTADKSQHLLVGWGCL